MSRPGFESPFEGVGNLRSEMQSLLQRKADSHEVSSLSSKADSLEHSLGEVRSEISSLRSELQNLQESVRLIQEREPHDQK